MGAVARARGGVRRTSGFTVKPQVGAAPASVKPQVGADPSEVKPQCGLPAALARRAARLRAVPASAHHRLGARRENFGILEP